MNLKGQENVQQVLFFIESLKSQGIMPQFQSDEDNQGRTVVRTLDSG